MIKTDFGVILLVSIIDSKFDKALSTVSLLTAVYSTHSFNFVKDAFSEVVKIKYCNLERSDRALFLLKEEKIHEKILHLRSDSVQ